MVFNKGNNQNIFLIPSRFFGPRRINLSCSAVGWPQTPIQVGDTAYVKVRYDKTDLPEYFQQLIQVYANIDNEVEVIVLSGKVLDE